MHRPHPDEKAPFSRFLRAREAGAVVAIFHELHPVPLILSREEWDSVVADPANAPPSIKAELSSRNLLKTAAEDDHDLATAKSDLARRLDNPSILYLVLVQGCNFACPYCPIPAMESTFGRVLMTPETMRAAIAFWERQLQVANGTDDERFVIFYGGEPLLNMAALEAGLAMVAALRTKAAIPHLRMMVCTNGALVSKSTAELFRQHDVMVAVGCDGPPEAHDALRRDTENQPTFEIVDRALKLLVAEGVQTFVSTSITPHNLSMVAQLSTFFAGYGIQKFGFNFLRGKLLLSLVPTSELPNYYEAATDGVIQNYFNFGRRHLEYQVERKFDAFKTQHFFPTDCNGYGNQLVVQPDGAIGNCPFLSGAMGNVHSLPEGFNLSAVPQVQEWRKRLPMHNPACHDCDAKSICGGGCAWNAQELKGDPLAIDDAMCLLTKKLFTTLLWDGHSSVVRD